MACWGICTSCHAALHSYHELLAVRVLAGIFESAVPSALMLISSQYFTRSEQAVRFAVWYSGLGIAQILGGLISWGFQHLNAPPTSVIAAWRMMFLAIGLFTVLLGIALIFALPDTPMSAWFLDQEEKVNLLEHVKGNQAGIENKRFHPKQLVESLSGAPIYIGFVMSLLVKVSSAKPFQQAKRLMCHFPGRALRRLRDILLGHPDPLFRLHFKAVGTSQHAYGSRPGRFDLIGWHPGPLLWKTLACDIRLCVWRHTRQLSLIILSTPRPSWIPCRAVGLSDRCRLHAHLLAVDVSPAEALCLLPGPNFRLF